MPSQCTCPFDVAGRLIWRGGCRADGSDAGLMHFLTSSEGYRRLCGMFAYVFLRRTVGHNPQQQQKAVDVS
jgi:hypothetical protein